MKAFNKCDVSVIITTYNSENYIQNTLDSIINQKLKPKKIIIVDDCSFDNTYNIVLRYENIYKDLIRVYRNRINKGVSYSRNFGMKCSDTNYIMFMDHDDVAESNLLDIEYNELINLLRNDKEKYALVYSSCYQIDKAGQVISEIIKGKQVESYEVLGYEFVRNMIITVSGVLLDKNSVIKVGGFDEIIKYSQDWDLWLKISQEGAFKYIDKPLISVRRHNENTSSRIENFLNDEIQILRKYDLEFIKKSVLKRNDPWKVNMIDFSSILIRLSKWDEAVEIIDEVLIKEPFYVTAFFYKGVVYIKKNELNKAFQEFVKCVNINPTHSAALNNLAGLFILKGDTENANNFLNRALSLHPNYLDAIHNKKIIITNQDSIKLEDIKITSRELREVLLSYSHI